MSSKDEIAVLFNLSSVENPLKILNKYDIQDLTMSKEWQFVKSFFENYHVIPSRSILCDQFPDLSEFEITDNTLDYYLDQVEKSQKLKTIQKALIGAQQLTERGEYDRAIDHALKYLSVHSNGKVVDTVSLQDTDKIISMYEKRVNNRLLGTTGWPTGFVQIDRDGNGQMPGELLGIMARPGVSKTFMLLYSAFSAWRRGARVVFVTPEMTKDEIVFRLLPMLAFRRGLYLSNTSLRLGKPVDINVLEIVLSEFRSNPLFEVTRGDEKGGISLDFINYIHEEHHPDLISIDGVRMFKGLQGDSWDILDRIFYGLQDIAVTKEVAISVSHQANRGASNTAQAPRLDNAAGGDGLNKAATYVITVARDADDRNIRYTTLQKARFGEEDIRRHPISYSVDEGNIGMEIVQGNL